MQEPNRNLLNRTIDLGYDKVEELEDRIGSFLKEASSEKAA